MKLSDGRERRRHQDQLQKCTTEVTVDDPVELETPVPPVTSNQSSPPVTEEPVVEASSLSETLEQNHGPLVPNTPTRKVYPTRQHTAVQRYQPTL